MPDHWDVTEKTTAETPFRLITPPARNFLNSTFNNTPSSVKKEVRPSLLIHPEDARTHNIVDGAGVSVGNARGNLNLHAKIFDGMQQGVLVAEGVWGLAAHKGGKGINQLVSAEAAELGSLSERLFSARLELIGEMDRSGVLQAERTDIAGLLRDTIASMNRDNFLVRPKLRLVEKYSETAAWENVTGDLGALAESVAPLPAQLDPESEDAKRFDMMVLNAELALLKHEPFDRYRNRIMRIASLLEDKANVPQVAAQIELLLDVQHEEWWTDITYPMLEDLRQRVRMLVILIDRHSRDIVTTDFADEMGDIANIELPGTGGAIGSPEFAQFRKKAEHFLKENLAEKAVAKVRSGAPLTAADIADLQRILVAAGVGDTDDFDTARERAGSFAMFVRSIVGLDREAAKAVFNHFLDDKGSSSNQIQCVNLILDGLTSNGFLAPRRLYEISYMGMAPQGPEAMFTEDDVDRLFDAVAVLTPITTTCSVMFE
jgi:type I restriction enzyme R subunit